MKIYLSIFMAILIVAAMAIGGSMALAESQKLTGANEIHLHPDLPNDGVLTIAAGDMGEYKIDTRFNMCFLVNINSMVKVPCKPFDIYFKK